MNKGVLNTQTTITRVNSNIDVFTFYQQEGEKNITAFVSETVENIGSVSFVEGELIFVFDNWKGVRFELNKKGELVVISNEANKFSINEQGELIYTN